MQVSCSTKVSRPAGSRLDLFMEIIPAIDLKGGKCVRLYQGDYSRETVFSEDPAGMARHWAGFGVPRLHVVDLDGADKGEVSNLSHVRAIVKAVAVPIELGGGIRNLDTMQKLLDVGVSRLILGTAAVEEPGTVQEACRRFGEAIVVGVDARDGLVATRGWRQQTSITAIRLMKDMITQGVKRFIYTDISRDGTLTYPNYDAFAALVAEVDVPIVASGGVSSVEHLLKLKQLGAEGAIIGRALYTKDLDLAEALAALGR